MNSTVKILPQVGKKIGEYFHDLPAPVVDYREVGIVGTDVKPQHLICQHCVCLKCEHCLCPVCLQWKRLSAISFLANPTNHTYVMLQYFNTDIVIKNIREIRDTFRPLLRREAIEAVQEYLRSVKRTRNEETTFVR